MKGAALGVLIGLAVFWYWWTHPPTGTVTTSEDFSLPPTAYPDNLIKFAQAIAVAEGFYVAGSIPQRANNPGDLKLNNGAPTIGGITVFNSPDDGWQALYHQLWLIVTGQSSVYNLDMTIQEMAQHYTATQQDIWANNVANHLGVDATSTSLWQVLA